MLSRWRSDDISRAAAKVSSGARADTADLFILEDQVSVTRFRQRNPGLYNQPTVITPDNH